jgi:hypothetical protein
LSAEQVGSALGATVAKDDAACTYFPTDAASPNASFVRQFALACEGSGPADLGYTETLDGLGEKAYVQRDTALGTTILVCSDRPFEIVVDVVGDSAAALDAAQQLAKEALDS